MKDWELARSRGDFAGALALLARTIENAAELTTLLKLLTCAAEIQVDDLGDLHAGIATYETILQQDMFHAPTWNALEVLYTAVEDWAKVVWLLEQRHDLSIDDAERVQLQLRIAALAEELLDNAAGAREAYERVLLLEPDNEQARAGLARTSG